MTAGNGTDPAASDLLAAAIDYALAGYPVLPLDGKIPRLQNGLHGASTDVGVVAEWWRRWPTANIGIRTGAASGLVVLDVDVQHGGAKTLAELERQHGKVPRPHSLTGGGGNHYLFTHPGGEVRNSAGKLGHGLDVRADGGYIVCPPSLHPTSGRVYKTLRPFTEREPMPAWLAAEAVDRRSSAAASIADVIPEGKRREAMLTVAGKLKRAGLTGAEILPTLRELNHRCKPPLDEAELESVAFKSTIEPDPDTAIRTVAAVEPRALEYVVGAFRKWLHLPDAGALYVTLAAVVANRLPGDPLWLLLVAASSSGKTEILFSIGGLEEVTAAATMTEAALLSGTPKREHAAGSSGGLLARIGPYGILTLKDFGSILSMHRDARAGVLAALREIFDGSWDRHVGVDGGKTLHWDGKLGLIAGVTTVVDTHHAVMDSLGSRFAFYRVDVDERDAQGLRALNHRAGARAMRAELRDAVTGFFAGLELPEEDTLTDDDKARLVTLADLVTMARSPVERDRVSRDIEMIPDPEAPARFALMLAALLEGLRVIGIDDEHAWQLVNKTAFDSMPAQRRRVLELLAATPTATTKAAALALGLPTTTARRTLEDLAAHRIVVREPGDDGKGDTWRLSAWTNDRYGK